MSALAQTRAGGPGLAGLPSSAFANDIERAAAAANQATFDLLETGVQNGGLGCNPGRVFDQQPRPTYDSAILGGTPCTEDAFFVYLTTRELVHTANELQGQGPTIGSLALDQEGLGLALRWTAAEELAAQGSMATEFANGQLSTLAARLTALRFGVTGGIGTAGRYELLRRTSPVLAQVGGGDAEAPSGEEYSPWGGFLNYGFGYGSKAPTSLEDAFDFDGSEITLGVDYRFRNNVVLGGIFGLSEQDIDFDEAASLVSVVDGNMGADGDSAILFAMSQGERLTVSGSIGVQSLDYAVQRNIKYPSFNPDLPSVYSIARSEPQTDVTMLTFGFAYAFSWNRFTLEPIVNIERLDITIDSFAEERSINLLSNVDERRRFDLAVSEQEIESLKTSLGLRFQFVLTPRFGVVIPYWSIVGNQEHEDDSRTITTGYASLSEVLGSSTFALPTDPPDDSYVTASAGVSMVLRGGRQRELDGPIAGGLSGFLQYATIEGREHFDDEVVTAGFRYEF